MCALAAFSTGRAEVRILAPTNGTVYAAYSTVKIELEPTFGAGENSVKYGVERDYYYPAGNLIAEIGTPPYSLTLSNVPAGRHKYVVWTGGDLTNATTSVEIVVTNPPVHRGPYSMIEVVGDSSAMGINNDGVIVVNSGDYAYTWTKGIIRWIPMPEGYRGVALEINNAGDITGWYYPRGRKQTAFIR